VLTSCHMIFRQYPLRLRLPYQGLPHGSVSMGDGVTGPSDVDSIQCFKKKMIPSSLERESIKTHKQLVHQLRKA